MIRTLLLSALPYLLAAQGGFNGPGRYEITNLKSGKVLDMDRNDQTSVIQFSSRGTDNQSWDVTPAGNGFFYFRNGMNGNALDAGASGNSMPMEAIRFQGSDSQQWKIDPGKDGNALIISKSGKTLDVPDGTNRDGARIQLYDLNGDSNQRFTFRRIGGVPGGNRADYVGAGNGPNYGGSGSSLVTCSSTGRRTVCGADTSGSVRLSRQLGGSACREGSTWGYDQKGIWVDRGCKAEFEIAHSAGVGPGTGNGPGPGNPNVRTITCMSDNGRRVTCDADTRNGVRMLRQLEGGSGCRQGSTWGYDRRGIWVDRGCRAEFQLGNN